jgi:hypothetical protein
MELSWSSTLPIQQKIDLPRVNVNHSLVRSVNRHVELGVLVHVAQHQAGLDDQLLGLEPCVRC